MASKMHEQLEKALKIAEKAHMGQVDRAGKPYIDHPKTVSKLAEGDYKVKTAALLHDVLEDSDLTAADLYEAGIDPEIIDALECLTHRDGEDYFDYVLRAKANPIAKAVKLADLTHNMDLSRLGEVNDEDIKRLEKYKKAVEVLKDKEAVKIDG